MSAPRITGAPAATQSSHFYRQLTRAVIASYVLAVLMISAAALWYALQNRDDRIASAIEQSKTLTRALDEHAHRALNAVDVMLNVVAEEIVARAGAGGIAAPVLHRGLTHRLTLLPQAKSLFVYGVDLHLRASSGPYPATPADGSTLDYVNTHRGQDLRVLYISKPLQSPATGQWLLPVSRRITDAQGRFLGVAGAIIDSSHFDTFYRELGLPPGQNLVLIRADGALLFRFPPIEGLQPGTDMSRISPIFRQPRPLADTTTMRILSKLDGIERIITYREIISPGLLVGHAHEIPILLAPWRRDMAVLASGVGGTIVVITILLAISLRQIRRRASDERQHNETLENRVIERTAELKAANEELEAFSYSVSHDLRTPLNIIGSYVDLLRTDHAAALPAEARDYLDETTASVSKMNNLIDDLLGLAYLSRQSINKSRVDLSALAREILDGLTLTDPARAVDIVIAPGLHAQADAGLVRIVLQNLLSNAWKYSSKTATARIEFDTRQDHGVPVFRVRDNGAGFDMAHAAKLFRPFQRLHTDQEYAGTGVGLATVARIIQRHGGRIWAESAPGQGATFFFTLPDSG